MSKIVFFRRRKSRILKKYECTSTKIARPGQMVYWGNYILFARKILYHYLKFALGEIVLIKEY
jgi:hypothetical protein